MLGYIFFGITLVFYIGLFFVNFSQPRMSGDAGMGYGLAIAALGLGFAISSLILTVSVANKGGFDWINDFRGLIIGLGWLFMAVATFACVAFKWEWHEGDFPQFLHWLAKNNGQVWMPLLMLVPYFFLLNAELRASISPNLYKIPLMIGFVVSAFMSLSLLFGWLKISAQQQQAQMQQVQSRETRVHDENLTYIAEQKPSDPIANILSYTGHFQDADVRSAALAKIKEKPDWEDKILQLLDNDYHCRDVYTFIEGNKVEHPEKFLEPLNRSILQLAAKTPEDIKSSNNLQHWTFEGYHIERLLRAIDAQFGNKGVDFRPALLKLQEAFATERPLSSDKNLQFDAQKAVNNWLKKH